MAPKSATATSRLDDNVDDISSKPLGVEAGAPAQAKKGMGKMSRMMSSFRKTKPAVAAAPEPLQAEVREEAREEVPPQAQLSGVVATVTVVSPEASSKAPSKRFSKAPSKVDNAAAEEATVADAKGRVTKLRKFWSKAFSSKEGRGEGVAV